MMRRVARLVTAPTTTPISVSEAKLHLRVTSSDDDTIIGIYVNAAIKSCEQYLQRKLITQTWKMWLDYWPSYIDVLFGDLQSVTHIKYTDVDDVEQTLSSSVYSVDINSVPGRIFLKDGETWPTDTLNLVNPIEIQFVTGYGATSASVPDDIRSALLLTVEHLYENRGNVVVGEVISVLEIPGTARTLLNNHRVWKWIL